MAKSKKKVKARLKFVIEGGNATPGQQLGPALGQHGINIGEFVNNFNQQTQDRRGELVPVILNLYEDRSMDMTFFQPPVSFLIQKEVGLKKGSATPNTQKVGKITKAQLKKIAERKLPDLNTNNLDSAVKIVAGTAKSMGLEVEN
ncbi:MAG: 50S ribosomal protein L11 [Candidatus Dojkabacteria bacterium]